jgi:hypothetical protein
MRSTTPTNKASCGSRATGIEDDRPHEQATEIQKGDKSLTRASSAAAASSGKVFAVYPTRRQ